MCRDALERDESCGSHFRVEHQTPDGEAKRDDARFAHVARLAARRAATRPRAATSSRWRSPRSHRAQGATDETASPRLAPAIGERSPARSCATTSPTRSPDMSFLEMLDVLNERLAREGGEPIAFESDCREGICGACGFMINGVAHGPQARTTVCQLHLRSFPRRRRSCGSSPGARARFPSCATWWSTAARSIASSPPAATSPRRPAARPRPTPCPIAKPDADAAMDAAACIGCGACVAACPNASASLFTAAKIAHLGHLPQGQARTRVARAAPGRRGGSRGLRRLQQRRRLRGGLPQGHPRVLDRAPESRLPRRGARAVAPGS